MLNFRWIDKMLRKLSFRQGRPSKQSIFGHMTSLIGENVIAAHSEKFPRATAYTYQATAKRKSDPVDPAELLLPYTNKRP